MTAPEILASSLNECPASFDDCHTSSDMWALGLVIYQMLAGVGQSPFVVKKSGFFSKPGPTEHLKAIFKVLGTPDRAWRIKYTGQEHTDFEPVPCQALPIAPVKTLNKSDRPAVTALADLMVKCLVVDPGQRITVTEALRLKCFSSFKSSRGRAIGLQPPLKLVIGPTRTDIIRKVKEDVDAGILMFHPAVLALYLFDHIVRPESSPDEMYIHFCGCYMVAHKAFVKGEFVAAGRLCGSSDSLQITLLFLERSILKQLECILPVQAIADLPILIKTFDKFRDKSVFQTLRR